MNRLPQHPIYAGLTALTALILISAVAVLQPAHAQTSLIDSDRFTLDISSQFSAVAFQQSNPWFGEDEANLGVEVDNWLELALSSELSFTSQNIWGGELFGTASFVATQTFGEGADGIAAGLDDPDDVTLEQLNLGWRRNLGDGDFFEIMGGNFDYTIGSGFLIRDGGSDGGNRGGFYLGARSAFREAGLIRLQKNQWLFEGFYLGNNPRRGGIEGSLAGANIEYDFGNGSLGVSYIEVADVDDPALEDVAEDLRTYDFRGSFKPTDDLTLSAEYSFQDGGDIFEGVGWYAQVDYDANFLTLSPTLSYRYAALSGDDPATPEDEAFEFLAYGYTDYGTWYQGEIVGNWIFANTNQNTHLIKASAPLTDKLSLTGILLNIEIDDPAGIGVTESDFGNEINVFLDWEASDRWFLSFAAAVLFPGDAAEEFTGGDDAWAHFMIYTSYSF